MIGLCLLPFGQGFSKFESQKLIKSEELRNKCLACYAHYQFFLKLFIVYVLCSLGQNTVDFSHCSENKALKIHFKVNFTSFGYIRYKAKVI